MHEHLTREPLVKPVKRAKRLNRTYKKRTTKKRTKINRKRILALAIVATVATATIFTYGSLTASYLGKLLQFEAVSVIKTVKPEAREIEIIDVSTGTIREVTAYNLGDPNQNWGDPCITASGKNGCELVEQGIKICAANFVPLGTKIYIENYGECWVIDRMNSRYKNRVDVGMRLDEKQRALNFGLQRLLVKVID